jgi:hypothetical protein
VTVENVSALLLLYLPHVLLAAGCASSATREQKPKLQSPWSVPPEARRTSTAIDPCADRLHELCGPLLMHYALHRRMPATLDDLRAVAGPDPTIAFECPVSRRTYVYNADGLQSPAVNGRIVLFDPIPAHDGKRWAVVLEETKPGQPLIPRVITIPEFDFPRPLPLPPASQPSQPQ